MANPEPHSRGRELADRFHNGVREAKCALQPGARDLPILRGILPTGATTVPYENAALETGQILAASGQIYLYHDSVVFESREINREALISLTTGTRFEPITPAILANLCVCEVVGKDKAVQFPVPASFLASLFASTPIQQILPRIQTYARRPIFDEQINLFGPGWHPEPGILVHGPQVEPVLHLPAEPTRPISERIPPHLAVLLGDFCFRSPADAVNAVGAFLTGLLMPLFISAGKALMLLDGNQPGIGKTLLARVAGIILDGSDPQVIHYTPNDDELEKRLCATLRGSSQSILLIDNAKLKSGGSVSSPVIEANSLAAVISLRILGVSANYVRPNDLLWFLTMNETKTSPDLVSRGLPIRFAFEGDPASREFSGRDPLDYAREHRTEILGELIGMIIRWNQAGRPEGERRHRCDRWARVIGGILANAGLPEFLSNSAEAAASFNSALDDLAALAEAAAREAGNAIVYQQSDKLETCGYLPGQWEELFQKSGIQTDSLDQAKSQRGRATLIGNFLTTNLGREVAVEIEGHPAKATLRAAEAGQRQKRYYFFVAWEDDRQRAKSGGSANTHQHQAGSEQPAGLMGRSRQVKRVEADPRRTRQSEPG